MNPDCSTLQLSESMIPGCILSFKVNANIAPNRSPLKYVVESQIGHGKFAQVYLCCREQHTEVLKFVNKTHFCAFKNRRGSRLTLQDEATVMAGLDHVGILRLYHAFDTNTHTVLALQWAPGGDLLHSLLEHGPFDEAGAIFFFRNMRRSRFLAYTSHRTPRSQTR